MIKFFLLKGIFLYFSVSDHAIDLVVNFFFCIVKFLFTKTNFSRCYLDFMSVLLRFCLLLNLLNSLITIRITSFLRLMMLFFLLIEVLLFFSLYVIVFQHSAVSTTIALINCKTFNIYIYIYIIYRNTFLESSQLLILLSLHVSYIFYSCKLCSRQYGFLKQLLFIYCNL